MRLLTAGIIMLVLTNAACHAANSSGFVTPMPTTWAGPEVFDLPRMKLRPDMVVTHTGVCTHASGVESSESRLIGIRQADHGLIEARLEVDGKATATLLYNDQGRVVHTKAEEGESESLAFFLTEVEALSYRPLTRNRPVAVRVSMRRLFPEQEAKDLPEQVLRMSFEVTTRYLGQTEFDGVRAAGYRTSGSTPPIIAQGMEFRMQVNALAYHDAERGVLLYSEMRMVMSGRQAGKPPAEVSAVCQQRLDRQKSSGL